MAHIDPTASPFIRQHGARLTGALPGSTIRINESVVEGDYIRTLVTASGPHGLEMQRKIYEPKVPGVKGHIYNQWFKVDDDAPKGYGLQAFASQVHEAKLLGFEKIKVTAGGGGNHRTGAYPGDMNGYYTWPRFGYSGPLYANGVGDGRYNLPMELRGATSVEHLMTHPKGRDWMRLHGTQTGYEFDLSDGSYNINHLIEYHHSETGGT